MSFTPAEVAACQTCGGRIIRKRLSGVWAAWLHEDETAWFCNPHVPHAADPKVA